MRRLMVWTMVWLPGLGPGVAVMVLAAGFVTGVRRMLPRRVSAGVAGMVMAVVAVMAGVAVTGDGAVCRLRGRPVFLS